MSHRVPQPQLPAKLLILTYPIVLYIKIYQNVLIYNYFYLMSDIKNVIKGVKWIIFSCILIILYGMNNAEVGDCKYGYDYCYFDRGS